MSWGLTGIGISLIGSNQIAQSQKAATNAAIEAQQQGISEGIVERRAASERGLEFLKPFEGVGQAGIEQAGFLTDPQAQFDFLQSNPLFQMALEQAGTETKQLAAARGRLSAGDTLQQLSKNVLLSAQPLIQEQKASIADLLNVGTGIAGSQANIAIGAGTDIANLRTSAGDVAAAGKIGIGQSEAEAQKTLIQGLATSLPLLADKFGTPPVPQIAPGFKGTVTPLAGKT